MSRPATEQDIHEIATALPGVTNASSHAGRPVYQVRGKSFVYEAHYPDGKKEVLLSVPRYNFNWQSAYRLAEPKLMPKGTKVRCVAHFDNSAKNPHNPDPTQDVFWGDQTWQEMMVGWMDFYFEEDAS